MVSTNTVTTNNMLKEKLNDNLTYKGYLLKMKDAAGEYVTVVGLIFVPID